MRAQIGHPAAIQNDDSIHLLEIHQPVGNPQHSAPLGQL